MSIKNARKVLEKFSRDCILCGSCQNECTLLNDTGFAAAEIASAVLAGNVNEEMLAVIQRCDLCGYCSAGCLVNLSPGNMFRAAREVLMQDGIIQPDDYDVMLVNRDWNFFTIYRHSFDINYNDLPQDKFDVLFFPGCSLASYSPELTRAAFAWLKQNDRSVGFSDLCCGKPLDCIGLTDQAERYLQRLRQTMDKSGAKQIITACSNCETHLKEHLPNFEVVSIYGLLREAGVRLEGSETLTFHDSCPDRFNPRNPADVRTLLQGYPQVEMVSHGPNAICCGSGGIVSMVDPELCNDRARVRLAEFADSGAQVCITSCMSCAHRLARNSAAGQVRHCLETVFDIPVDYAQIEANTQAMWQGSLGELNLQRMAQARDLDLEQTDR